MFYKFFLFILFSTTVSFCQTYPDQFYSYENDSLIARIESMGGTEVSPDGKSIILSEGYTNGTVIFKIDSSEYPFNRGLPSWNGHIPNDNSSFKVVMRYYTNSWSPWLTVGFWKSNLWSSYGTTKYTGGKIDYDNAVLDVYCRKWQYQVLMKRTSAGEPSPRLNKLSFFVSDQRTTDNTDISSIVNDKPEAIFVTTHHYYQYALDPGIGGNICSPTSVSMVLKSYNIDVDPLQFAKDNYDPYWGIFGIWPRAVQNAAEYNLKGEVNRYRTWSKARKVLADGGRIVMSVGLPLYSGHLIMLAGFDSHGNPLVHDPARSDGYGYKFNKTSLSQSWFLKGGVAYTFFPDDTTSITGVNEYVKTRAGDYNKFLIYPNPFNPQTNISFETASRNYTEIKVYDISGREVETIFKNYLEPGSYKFNWDASSKPSGMYFIRVASGNFNKIIKAVLLK